MSTRKEIVSSFYGQHDEDTTEWEKAQAGYLYDANYEPELIEKRLNARIYAMSSICANHQTPQGKTN